MFSVCIPNYNYGKYLRSTCNSVTAQSYGDYEILISDNQSTDGSIDFIQQFAKDHTNTRIRVNPINIGFAANLEKVTSMAKGNFLILLSSDDLMNEGCLQAYWKVIQQQPHRKFVLGSSVYRIDSKGAIVERSKPDPAFWRDSDIDYELSHESGVKIYKVAANEMLRRSLMVMGNPYYFLTVCYPRALHQKVGGYSGGRMYNPDKWFNWKLFTQAEFVLLIDEPLFSYRWHMENQAALETSFGHLRYLVDEYRNTIELTNDMLQMSSISRKQSEINFVKRNIYRHGIGEFVKGRWLKSLRIFFFGLATFPQLMLRRSFFVPYVVLLLITPIGSEAIRFFYNLFKGKGNDR